MEGVSLKTERTYPLFEAGLTAAQVMAPLGVGMVGASLGKGLKSRILLGGFGGASLTLWHSTQKFLSSKTTAEKKQSALDLAVSVLDISIGLTLSLKLKGFSDILWGSLAAALMEVGRQKIVYDTSLSQSLSRGLVAGGLGLVLGSTFHQVARQISVPCKSGLEVPDNATIVYASAGKDYTPPNYAKAELRHVQRIGDFEVRSARRSLVGAHMVFDPNGSLVQGPLIPRADRGLILYQGRAYGLRDPATLHFRDSEGRDLIAAPCLDVQDPHYLYIRRDGLSAMRMRAPREPHLFMVEAGRGIWGELPAYDRITLLILDGHEAFHVRDINGPHLFTARNLPQRYALEGGNGTGHPDHLRIYRRWETNGGQIFRMTPGELEQRMRPILRYSRRMDTDYPYLPRVQPHSLRREPFSDALVAYVMDRGPLSYIVPRRHEARWLPIVLQADKLLSVQPASLIGQTTTIQFRPSFERPVAGHYRDGTAWIKVSHRAHEEMRLTTDMMDTLDHELAHGLATPAMRQAAIAATLVDGDNHNLWTYAETTIDERIATAGGLFASDPLLSDAGPYLAAVLHTALVTSRTRSDNIFTRLFESPYLTSLYRETA